MALLPVEEALERLLSDVSPLQDVVTVALRHARGRVLAGDLAARRTQPPFTASAMDGYAMRQDDIATVPSELTVVGQSAAGHGFAGEVGKGEAVRIFTGAPLPAGTDTVVIQENVERLPGTRVRVLEGSAPGRHIRRAGLDFEEGEKLIEAGDRLDAGRLMLAAAMNHATLPVRRRPLVGILATGDELVAPGEEPGPDQIVASNTFGVAAIVEEAGGDVLDLGIAGDRREAIQAGIDAAERGGADVLVTLGGASVGDHDLVQDALTGRGMVLDFWKIAMRPGKPLMFGRLGTRRVLGLPGNPVSSMVCAQLFLRPLVTRLAGLPSVDPVFDAVLGKAMPENDHRQDYVRATLGRRPDGTLVATPFDLQELLDDAELCLFAGADRPQDRTSGPPKRANRAGSTCCASRRDRAALARDRSPRHVRQHSTQDLQAIDHRHHMHPFTDHGATPADERRVITKADGVWLWDSEGNRILDGMAGLWCVNVGHGRREIVEAVRAQMSELSYYNTFFKTTHPPAVALAAKLAEIAPEHMNMVFFGGSGSDANDTVVRMVRTYWQITGRPEKQIIISRKNAYHGSTVAGAALGGMSGMHGQGGMLARHPPHRAALLVRRGHEDRHDAGPIRDMGGPPAGGSSRRTRRGEGRRLHRRTDPGRRRRDHPSRHLLAGECGAYLESAISSSSPTR